MKIGYCENQERRWSCSGLLLTSGSPKGLRNRSEGFPTPRYEGPENHPFSSTLRSLKGFRILKRGFLPLGEEDEEKPEDYDYE